MLLTLYLYGRLLGRPLLVGEVILPLLDVICLSAKRTRRHLKARELLEPCTYAACMPCMAARKPDRLLIPFTSSSVHIPHLSPCSMGLKSVMGWKSR